MKQALVLATLAVTSGVAMAGISATKHNLSTGGTGENHLTAGTEEICVFCHTPHGANTGVTAPLWNKQLPSTTYTTYSTANSSTIDGSVLAVGSVSAACLSCHDGTQAMDSMINEPGSGLDNGATFTWTGARQSGGILQGVAALGADLTNDHPIGIQYCGGGIQSDGAATPASTGSCKDTDFTAPTSDVINGSLVWWVDTGTAGRQKTDMILYTRAFSGTDGPSVECASCHDPHVESKGDATNPQVAFLRVSQAGSGVCLSCHTK
ncbi:MAG: hypothetical protein KDG55_01455 [Rhodocyclaceae bacterium]|nr:hypothetical protein [Rhodocyclaceae bacterium]